MLNINKKRAKHTFACLLALTCLALLVDTAYSQVVVSPNVHFGLPAYATYIQFSTEKTFDTIYREDNYWYFNGYGFQVQNANMTITKFFQNNQLIFRLSSTSPNASISKIYVKSYGSPYTIGGTTVWSYTDLDKILTIQTNQSSITITVQWGYNLPPTPVFSQPTSSSTNETSAISPESGQLNLPLLSLVLVGSFCVITIGLIRKRKRV
jgi:hypothetical protein